MTCVELQQSLATSDDGSSLDQQNHLKTCTACSALVRELNLIIASAAELRGSDEPSPRVWNSIEIALRREGLIHPPRTSRSLIPSFGSRWGAARWVAPVAALFLITLGIYLRPHPPSTQVAKNVDQTVFTQPVSDAAIAGLNDDDLLQEVAQQTPAMKAQYAEDLRRVNAYIQDAKGAVNDDPNDEEARRSLLEAYQEKAMLFDLAMDRSLP
ncbi:MAG TPA: hypothetical protein VKV39_13395 [Candidatus Sulfotelmatobacter sp.]|nr:hypothetical protein [Candidatus Sulfotelmatobacter sp.]